MRKVNNTPWVAGAVVISLIIIAVGYFFGVLPKLDDADDLNEQAESQESLNDVLEMKLIQLRADFAKLEEYRAEIEDYEVAIPLEPQLPELIRITDDLANDAGVALTRTAFPLPTPVAIPSALEGAISLEGLVLMSVNYEIVGDYTDIFAFVDALQQEYPRHVLIRDFRVEAQEFEPHRDPMSFTYRIKMDTDMYAMVKGGIPTDNDIDYDIPGLAPPVDSEGEKTDDAGGNADEADADSDLSTDE